MTITQNKEEMAFITKIIQDLFPHNNCYIVGGSVIEGHNFADVDILVIYKNPISIVEKRITSKLFRELVKGRSVKFSLIMNLEEDNKSLADYPHYNIKTKKCRIVNKEQFSDKEYESFRKWQKETIKFKKVFNEKLIKTNELTARCKNLLKMSKSYIPKKYQLKKE